MGFGSAVDDSQHGRGPGAAGGVQAADLVFKTVPVRQCAGRDDESPAHRTPEHPPYINENFQRAALEVLEYKLQELIPELVELNGIDLPRPVQFTLISEKTTSAFA